jgi:hypothetical protein
MLVAPATTDMAIRVREVDVAPEPVGMSGRMPRVKKAAQIALPSNAHPGTPLELDRAAKATAGEARAMRVAISSGTNRTTDLWDSVMFMLGLCAALPGLVWSSGGMLGRPTQ